MTTYAAGFEAGERQAFEDRHNRSRMQLPQVAYQSEYWRGFGDGYTPRTVGWLRLAPMPVDCDALP